MRRNLMMVMAVGLTMTASVWGGEAWEKDRIFWLDMNWRGAGYGGKQTDAFDAQSAKGMIRGKTLSKETVAVVESSNATWGELKNLPTGASDQAVEWPAEGILDPAQGAISLFVQGRKWDASTAQRETLVVLDGKEGSLSLEKNKPNTLAIVVNGTAVIETPLTEPDQYHHLVVNFGAAGPKQPVELALYVDRHLVGSKQGIKLPSHYDRLVVGQLGPGPGTDKVLDNVAVYRRPLAQGEIAKLYYLEGEYELPKLATVPFTSKPPKIDGIFDAGEWDQAGEVCGFEDAGTGKPWDVEDTIRLQYDKDYLYFAYHCPPPASIKGNAPMIAAMLKNSVTVYDSSVEFDDALWINVVKPYPSGDYYHLCVNGMNTHYDFAEGGSAPGSIEKSLNLHWDPKWSTASTLTMEGWSLEGAIPFKDLKMETPKPGQLLHINFTRYWRTILGGTAQWAHGQDYGCRSFSQFYQPASPIRFGEPGGVAVQLAGVGNLVQGALAVRARLVNPGTKPAKVRAEMTSNSGEIQESREIEVPANGSAPYEFKGRVIKPETGTVEFRVTDITTGALLFVSAHPLMRADHPSVYLRKYPSWNLVKLETEFDSLSETPASELAAELTVMSVSDASCAPVSRPRTTPDRRSPDDDRRPAVDTTARSGDRRRTAIAKEQAAGFTRYAHTFEISTKDLPAGKYVAEVRFRRGRQTLDTVKQEFEVKPLPGWYNNTIGCDDPQRPPYPFTRMELHNDNDVMVWGRTYSWGDSLLPVQVQINPACELFQLSGNRPELRSPMRLVGKAGGTEFSTDKLKAGYQWREKLPMRMVGKRSVTNGNLSITADVRMEFDGFCWVKLTLAPVKDTVEIQSLAFEEPFTPEFSDVVNAGEYSLVGTGKFPDQPFQKSASLPIWVGNGDGGLQTFVETLATWNVNDLQTTLQLIPGKDGGTMRYNLIDKPMVLSKPRTIEFGFVATPVRIKEWRTYRETSRGHRGTQYGWYPGPEWNVGDLGWVNPNYNMGGVSPWADRGSWVWGQPYMNTDLIPISDSDVQEFGDEWLCNAGDRWRDKIGKTGEMILTTYASKSFRDWVVWKMNELFQRGGGFGGWYYDCVSPQMSANPYANAGVVLDDPAGAGRAPSKCLLGLRDMTKRLYTLCRRTYPDGQTMMHSSGMPNMAYDSFCEIFWDGENLNSSINPQQPTYRGLLTPERFRAEYMGHNFGPKLWFLGQGRISLDTMRKLGPDVMQDHLSGLFLLHDGPVTTYLGNPVFGKDGRQLIWHCDKAGERELEAVRRYDLYSPAYRFLPYWKQDAATGLKDRQFVSWYVHQPIQTIPSSWQYWTREETDASLPHRVIGIFCNESDWKGEMAVKVDLKKLGFTDGAKVRAINAVHSTGYRMENVGTEQETGSFYPKPEETATLTGNELRFPMTEWNFRMIVLEEVKQLLVLVDDAISAKNDLSATPVEPIEFERPRHHATEKKAL